MRFRLWQRGAAVPPPRGVRQETAPLACVVTALRFVTVWFMRLASERHAHGFMQPIMQGG